MNRGLTDYWRAFRSFSPGARLYLWHTMLGSVAWSMVTLLLNLYLYSLGYRQDFMGLVNALPAAVTMALGLPVGGLADRYGYRAFLLAGSTLTAVSGIGVALAAAPGAILAWAALSGMGGTLTWVIGTPYLASQSDEANRMELLSVNFALMTAAGFAGSLLAGQIPQRVAAVLATDPMATGPLRAGMLAAGLLSTLAIVPLLRLAPRALGCQEPRSCPLESCRSGMAPRPPGGGAVRPHPGAGRPHRLRRRRHGDVLPDLLPAALRAGARSDRRHLRLHVRLQRRRLAGHAAFGPPHGQGADRGGDPDGINPV
ncbi:MAG: MFS transporter, partial [Firmicutes bacterium]|nr:MFS transporter [Bacillota bacterium]